MLFTIFQSCILFQNCRDFLSHILCFILISCCSIFKDRFAIALATTFLVYHIGTPFVKRFFKKTCIFLKPLQNRRCSFDSFVIVSSFSPIVKRIFKYFPTFLKKTPQGKRPAVPRATASFPPRPFLRSSPPDIPKETAGRKAVSSQCSSI